MKSKKIPELPEISEEMREHIRYMRGHRELVLGRLASVITRCSMMYITRRLPRFDLGSGQAFILAELLNKDGVSQDDIRHIVKLDKGTITRGLQYLEDREYIRRVQDQEDRRITRVFVTPKARAIEEDFFAMLLRWNAAISKGLSDEEYQQAAALMNRIAQNAEAMAYEDDLDREA